MLRRSFKLVLRKRRAVAHPAALLVRLARSARRRRIRIAASAAPRGCSSTTAEPKPAYRAFRQLHAVAPLGSGHPGQLANRFLVPGARGASHVIPARSRLDRRRCARQGGKEGPWGDAARRVALAVLCPAAVRPARERGGPNGVLRHRLRAAARRPGPPGDGGSPSPDRPLPAQLEAGGADAGLLSLGIERPGGRRPCLARNPAGPLRVGVAVVGRRPGTSPGPRSTAPPTGRRGGTSSRPRWRATGPAAATGPTGTASSSERAPRRCRSSPGRSGTSPT